MFLFQAVQGFLLDGQAGNLSPTTVKLYSLYLNKLVDFLDNPPLEKITSNDLLRYMSHLRNDYIPIRTNGDKSVLSPSAIDNHWKAIRSFYNWCEECLSISRPDQKLPRPKFKLPEITPFTEQDIQKLLAGCEYTKVATRPGQKPFRMKRPTARRDKALIYVLLDTGLRVSEIYRLKIDDVQLETGEVYVEPFGSGQKTKPRTVVLGKKAKRAVWMYLAETQAPDTEADTQTSLFGLSTNSIRSVLNRLGDRANVLNVHPHRFRHTFAIQYLRNGGDVFTLKRLLGHSSLDMVQHYLSIAEGDIKTAHQSASPADRWRL